MDLRLSLFLLWCSPVGVFAMGQRGRPPVLKDRKTTTVSIESRHSNFILKKNIDLSKLVRDTIDVLMQEEEAPIEKLKRQKEELEKEKQDKEIQIKQIEMMIQNAEEVKKQEEEAGKIFNELDELRQKHFREYKKNVKKNETCKPMWLTYLKEGLKFCSDTEAKSYALDFWIKDGMDETTVKAYLKLD